MDNKQGIFGLWLKNFLALVFMQSFQAIFMAVVIMVMARTIETVSEKAGKAAITVDDSFVGFNVDEASNTEGVTASTGYFICSIIAYAGVTGIIKLQKLVKNIFGIQDSPLLGDLSKNMRSLMHSAFHAVDMGRDLKRVWDNVGSTKKNRESIKSHNARLQRPDNAKKYNELLGVTGIDGAVSGTLGKGENVNSLEGEATGNSKGTTIINNYYNGSGTKSGYSREQLAELFSNPDNFDSKGNFIQRSPYEQMLHDAEMKERQADKEFQEAKTKAAVRTLSTVAGLGIANGASDDFEEAIATGNYLSDGLTAIGNKATKGVVNGAVRKNAAKKLKENAKKLEENTDKEFRSAIETVNQAIVDSTENISTGTKIPKNFKEVKEAVNKAADHIKEEADDWLNTQFTTKPEYRVTRKESKKIIEDNRKKYDKD